jgi:formylglycine-generating enzyme required for sulfatase activity
MKLYLVIFIIMTGLLALLAGSCSDQTASNPVSGNPSGFTPLGMTLIEAKTHSFQMGSANGIDDELPVHTVSFTHNYWIDTTEVTQGDYDSLMAHHYAAYTTPSWHQPYGLGVRYPAYYVLWADAALYCNARSRRDGLDSVYSYTSISGTPGNLCQLDNASADLSKNGYRLPTEAEWEYACRAGGTTDFFWGRTFNPYPSTAADTAEMDSHAVWYANSWQFGADSAIFGTRPVASKIPNAYHLYDMSGNLSEWCHDWYGEYAAATATDPVGPDSGYIHCIRGGSWGSHAVHLRSANRTFSPPDYSYYFIGFRVVLPVQ